MRYLLLFIGLVCVLLDSYYGVEHCNFALFGIDDAAMAFALGGLGSALGGLFGSSSTKSTNAANLQIARETNEQNYKMFKEQMGFTEDMWNKQNAYNDPSAQMERFRNAGVNPYAALGVLDSGNADAVSAPSPNPAVTGAPMQNPSEPMSRVMSSIGESLAGAFSNSEKAIDLMTRHQKNVAQINQLESQGILNKDSAAKMRQETEGLRRKLEPELQLLGEQIGFTKAAQDEALAHAEVLRVERKLKDYHLTNISPLEVRKLNGEIDKLSAEYDWTYADIDRLASQIRLNDANANSINYLKEFIADELFSREELNYYNATPHSETSSSHGFHIPYFFDFSDNTRIDTRSVPGYGPKQRHAKFGKYQKRKIRYGGIR